MSSSPSSGRHHPRIHDHETLRLIGRGAYGEVWMARSVTGVLRAVKVVWRSDYDYEEAFEREFEAIKHYEPVSRRHAGLVPVLQVGRNDEDGFYYYVMELADDVECGRDFTPEGYRPLTLSARMRKLSRVKAEECLRVGETVAEAMQFMHQNGLIHRDIKPSNLVFIDGVCRLADIGLVALLGQRSFVGTEGFVAPEGPGTAAADIFSLGMVLYEASTGKDRLDFPDLPTAGETGSGLPQWRLLHQVICRACAQKAMDRYATAQDMAMALRGEKPPATKRQRRWIAGVVLAVLLLAGAGLWWLSQQPGVTSALHRVEPLLSLRSEPSGAEVYSNGRLLGRTPFTLNPPLGVPTIYQIRQAGYRLYEIEHLPERNRPVSYEVKLEISQMPQPGERWTNSLGLKFLPKQSGHLSEQPVEMRFFDQFTKSSGRPFEGRVIPYQVRGLDRPIYLAAVPPADAEAFRYWLTDVDRAKGFLTNEHHYELEALPWIDQTPESARIPATGDMTVHGTPTEQSPRESGENGMAFFLRVERQSYGSVVVRSNPTEVKVFQREELLGLTPLELSMVKVGEIEYELRAEGYTDVMIEGDVSDNTLTELYVDMEARRSVTFGREWKNSMGLRFLPLGEVMMSATEVRRRDYLEYTRGTSARKPLAIPEVQKGGAAYPAIGVERGEARDFCRWLTQRDRELNLIGKTDSYRLPTDEEWSRAAGLPLERGQTPAERNGRIRGIYPWGYAWPPPRGVDNLADESFARKQNATSGYIQKYEDKWPYLAPVHIIAPGPKGFSGLAGNVSEWVETDYEPARPGETPQGTLRGGNWRTFSADELLSSARIPVHVSARRDTIGFRIVLSRGSGAP